MIDLIATRFDANLARACDLKFLAAFVENHFDSGLAPDAASDVLRSTVVSLHATLEDLVRSVAEWKLPSSNPGSLRDVPLLAGRAAARPSFTMKDLAAHRGIGVSELIQRSVASYLDRKSFNHPGEIRRILERIGQDTAIVTRHSHNLAAMMNRRHLIAHRADRTDETGPPVPRAIDRSTVDRWNATVASFGVELIVQLRGGGPPSGEGA